MEFQNLVKRAKEIRDKYAVLEVKQYGSAWTTEELALGFVGDVGDLAKLIIAQQGRRNIPEADQRLEHELADCFWSIIVLSEAHHIDLENVFLQTMDELDAHLNNLLEK